MAGAIMELLQQMRDAIQEGPGSRAGDIFKPVPKWYVENFCGQCVAEKVSSICRALQSLPDKLDQVQDAQSQGDALEEARGNLKTEIETGSTGISADQIKDLQDGVPRYMLGDKCLPDILKWNSLTGSRARYLLLSSEMLRSEKPSARALWYGLNSMLKSFMVVAGNKKLANASAGDSAGPSQSDKEGEEVCAETARSKGKVEFPCIWWISNAGHLSDLVALEFILLLTVVSASMFEDLLDPIISNPLLFSRRSTQVTATFEA